MFLFLHFESVPKCTISIYKLLPISSLKYVRYAYDNQIGAQMGIYLKEKD